MRKSLILLIVFIILVNSVYGLTEYTQVGSENLDFILGTSLWNSERSNDCGSGEILCSTRNIDNPVLMPLVADLDNDSVNEIIIFDNDVIRLYRNPDLEIVDSYNSIHDIDYGIIFDIDDDGFKEIITVGDSDSSQEIEIVEYNGTLIFQQINLTLTTHTDGEILIGCSDVERCIAIYGNVLDGDTATPKIYGEYFNSTDVSGVALEINSGSASAEAYCFSKLRELQISDYDNDGNIEFISSYTEISEFSEEELYLVWLDINSTNHVIIEHNTLIDSIDFTGTGGDNCAFIDATTGTVGTAFTSPLTFDIDGSVSNGDETIIGFRISNDDFKMHSFKSDGTFLDDYPEITNGEGRIVSNVIRGNFFTDTGSEDFCVLGYENNAEILNLVCASEQTSQIPETNDFDFDISTFYNVTATYSSPYNIIVHSTQQDNTLTSGTDLSEIITSYGIFALDFILINELILIWENPKIDGVVYNIDYEQINLDDLLILTNTNLWYIDDLFINQNANLSRYTTNPSIRSIIQINESVAVTITCLDREGDNVMAGLIAYEGLTNEQSFNSSFGGSGTEFPLSFNANQTIANGVLEIFCRDINHNETVGISTTFSVALNGASFGDSFFDSGDLLEEPVVTPEGEGGTNQTATDNLAREGIISFCNSLRITPTFLLIVLILVGNVFLIASMSVVANLLKASLIIALSIDILGVALFSYLQLVSAVWIISLIFILILVGVLWIFSKLTSGGE